MKIAMPIGGLSLLEHLVNRVYRAKSVNKVVIAAPHKIDLCMNEETFIGSEEDVLDRYYQCAKKYRFDVIVRLTADCPFVPPYEIDRVEEALLPCDYATNRPCSPDGWDVEVFTFAALEDAWKHATDKYEREHVTPFIKSHATSVVLASPKLSVDTEEDLERVRRFYELEQY